MKARDSDDLVPNDTKNVVKPAGADGPALVSLNDAIFRNVRVELHASLGQAEMAVEDLLALRSGSVLKLDARLNDLVELRLNESVVARGEIVAVGDSFGLRIVEIARSA